MHLRGGLNFDVDLKPYWSSTSVAFGFIENFPGWSNHSPLFHIFMM